MAISGALITVTNMAVGTHVLTVRGRFDGFTPQGYTNLTIMIKCQDIVETVNSSLPGYFAVMLTGNQTVVNVDSFFKQDPNYCPITSY